MIDTNTMRDDIKNVISQGVIGGAKKPVKSPKTEAKKPAKKPVKSAKTEVKKSVKKPVKSPKQPIGYVWKMSNSNGIITREAHPIYNMTEAKKIMYDKMRKIFNFSLFHS
jgi:hypothetical protein